MARTETLSHQSIGGSERKIPRSLTNVRSQHNLAEAKASARYFASVEERETVSYFLTDRVMGLGPRKTNKLEVERLSFGSPAQFALEKADRDIGPRV